MFDNTQLLGCATCNVQLGCCRLVSPSFDLKLVGIKLDSAWSFSQAVSVHQIGQELLHVQPSFRTSFHMMDKLPEEMMLHSKMLGSRQELLVHCWMSSCLIIFKDFAQHLWLLLLCSQLWLFKCILGEIAHGCQRSKRIGRTCAFSMGNTRTDFGDQL